MRRLVIAVVFVVVVMSLAVGCAVTPGNCYTRSPFPPPIGDISMSYDGPADTFENASVFDDAACTTPSPWVSNATVVTAPDRTTALAICASIDPSLVTAEHLATSGWTLVSGAGVPGTPIAVNAWGCDVGVV